MNKCTLSIVALTVSILATSAHAVSISGQGTWETTLQGRDLDGDFSNGFEAYYDTVLDITWLANVNYAGTTMNWRTAKDWAAGLTLGGYTDWRLPNTDPVNGTSYNYNYAIDGSTDVGFNISAPGTIYAGSTGSEMAHLFYNTLGNLAFFDTSGNVQHGTGVTNTGPFSIIPRDGYWSATEYAPSTIRAWYFYTGDGDQYHVDGLADSLYAWAVHEGDVGAAVVPVPAAVWLFGSGLLGLIGLARKRRT